MYLKNLDIPRQSKVSVPETDRNSGGLDKQLFTTNSINKLCFVMLAYFCHANPPAMFDIKLTTV